MSKNATWPPLRCLTTTLVMMNGLVLLQAFAVKEVPQKYGSTIIVLRHQKYPTDANNYNRYSISGNGKTKLLNNFNKYLQYILIKLKNVIHRYDVKKSEVKAFFSGVADRGIKKYGDFKDLLPKHWRLENFTCSEFRHRKSLKRRTNEVLWKFHRDVQTFDESFQELIDYEKSPRFEKEDRSNGNRLKILNELQNDLKMLDVEIIEIIAMTTNKRLNLNRRPKSLGLTLLPPKSQTDLMIRECEIIQNSEKYLKGWKKRLRKMCNCWKEKRVEFGQQKKEEKNVRIMHSTRT